jgi:hypothetical protein
MSEEARVATLSTLAVAAQMAKSLSMSEENFLVTAKYLYRSSPNTYSFSSFTEVRKLAFNSTVSTPSTIVELWLKTLRIMIHSKELFLSVSRKDISHDHDYIGWIVNNEVWLLPSLSFTIIRDKLGDRWTYTRAMLSRQLRDAITIIPGDGGSITIPVLAAIGHGRSLVTKRRIDGNYIRVLILDRRTLRI